MAVATETPVRSRVRPVGCLTLVALCAGFVLAPAAHADLAVGSRHPLMVGKGKHVHIAMPVPTVTQVPALRWLPGGRVEVVTKARYVAANWRSSHGRLRDRAMVTLHVARRLVSTGPDPSASRFRRPTVHHLRRERSQHTYRVTLPVRISRYLEARGAFGDSVQRRTAARRLVWVDVQLDRDYQAVDGRYD